MEEKDFETTVEQNETEASAEAAAEPAEAVSETPAEAVQPVETVSEAPVEAPAEAPTEVVQTETTAEAVQEIPAAAAEEAPAEMPAEEAPKDPDATLSLDEMPQEEETGVLTEEDIFGKQDAAKTEDTVSEDTETAGETYETPRYESGAYNNDPYGSGSYNYNVPGASYGREAYQRSPGYITKRAFILILIIAMLLTTLMTVGITTAYTTYLNNKNSANGHATEYTLTTSNESLSFKSIIEKTQDSIVSITTESVTNDMWMQQYVTQGAGSGVIIQSDGYIITCEHVIEGARKVTVTLRDGKEYPAEIIGADASNDIAVIKINAKNLQEATYGDSSKLVVGDQVVAIGNPLGTLSGTATTGIISALNRNLTIDNRTLNLLQTDASINPGNSGGGLFDSSGNLIGIVEAKSTGSDIDGLGFATPINKAAKIAKDIIEKGGDVGSGSKKSDKSKSSSNKVMIGIMVAPVDDATAKEYGYAHGGLLVKSINSQEAMMAGLQTGDIIYKADGKTITNNDDLSKVLAKKNVGDSVKLSVARENGMTAEITAKLIGSDSTY